MKKFNSIYLFVGVLIMFSPLVLAQSPNAPYSNFVWFNMPLMFFLDFVIIGLAALSIYFAYSGFKTSSGAFKRPLICLFLGMILISLGYFLDLYAMIIRDIPLMTFFHLEVFWWLNLIAFGFFTCGFFEMRKVFAQISKV